MIQRTLFALGFLAIVMVPGLVGAGNSGVEPSETNPTTIMTAVENRPVATSFSAVMSMRIEDGAGRARTRSVVTRSMDFAAGTKSLMIFKSPADVKNTGLLSIDYDAGSKEDDQWLYLPSLRKSTRIISSQKATSFMGTDFSYADMTKLDSKDFTYKMVKQEVMVDNEACWLIESRPNNPKTKKETGYLKSYVWVSKEKLMVLQIKAWVRAGKKLKYIQFTDVRNVDGFWIAHKMQAKTKRKKKVLSQTTLAYESMAVNDPKVSESDFTQRRLEKGL